MPPIYKNKEEASLGLTKAFTPTGGSLTQQQQMAIANAAALVPQTPLNVPPPSTTTINPDIIGNVSPLVIPPMTPATNYQAVLAAMTPIEQINSAITQTQNKVNPFESAQNDLSQQLLGSISKLGTRGQFQLQQEDVAANALGSKSGLTGFTNQLTDINNQIQTLQKEALAIPLQLQEDFAGRGATAGGVAPIQAGQIRMNTIKSLGLSAIAQTLQGNIASAQATAKRATDIQFEPEQAKLDYLREALRQNEFNMSREDKKRADMLNIQLDERQRILNEEKENKNLIYAWAAEASKIGGAPAVIVNQALSAGNPSQALALLAPYFQDPNAKQLQLLDIESRRLQLKEQEASIEGRKLENTRLRQEINNFGKGGIEDANKLLSVDESIKLGVPYGTTKGQAAQQFAEGQSAQQQGATVATQDKINTVNSLLKSPGLAGSVGPSIFGRSGGFGLDELTGAKQDFIAGIEQLREGLSLDNLISAKARGATFGALSDAELRLLANSASKLSTWAIKDGGGNVTGYNASESAFKAELNKIANLAQRDLELKQQKTSSSASQDVQVVNGVRYVKGADGLYYKQ